MVNANGEEGDGISASKKLEYHPTVRDLPRDEQPRQRLRHAGPQALSVAELLAIALRTGIWQTLLMVVATNCCCGSERSVHTSELAIGGSAKINLI